MGAAVEAAGANLPVVSLQGANLRGDSLQGANLLAGAAIRLRVAATRPKAAATANSLKAAGGTSRRVAGISSSNLTGAAFSPPRQACHPAISRASPRR